MIHQSSAIKILVSQSLLSTYAICVLSALSVLSLLRHYLGGGTLVVGHCLARLPEDYRPVVLRAPINFSSQAQLGEFLSEFALPSGKKKWEFFWCTSGHSIQNLGKIENA